MKGKKINRKVLGIIVSVALLLCIIITIFNAVSLYKRNKADQKFALDSVNSSIDSVSISEVDTESTSSVVDSETNEFDSDELGLLPIDCNQDFWEVKMGIAECYDHVFKGHMDDTAYYSGSCDKHDQSEIQELACQVKLLRSVNDDGEFAYYAVLPEIGWEVQLYDDNLQSIIDAQIADAGSFMEEKIVIVMYYYDNSIQIEIAE